MRQRIEIMRCVECGDFFFKQDIMKLPCGSTVCCDCYTMWQDHEDMSCRQCDGDNPNCNFSIIEYTPPYNDYGYTLSDADSGL